MTTPSAPVNKSKSPFVPVYRRIEASLRERVVSGAWHAGTMIPGRRELARQFGVDLNTLQNAVRLLVADGTLRAEGRRGTFVASATATAVLVEDGRLILSANTASAGERHLVVGVIASITSEASLVQPSTDEWQSLFMHSLEQALSPETAITVRFENRWRGSAGMSPEPSVLAAKNLVASGANALIVVAPKPFEIDDVLTIANSARVPIVLVTPDYAVKRMTPQIRYDNSHAGFMAADHLLQRGYRNLTYFAPYTNRWSDERLVGVQEAVNRAGLPESSLLISECDRSVDIQLIDQEAVAYGVALRLLRSRRDAWGIVAVNDHAGWGLMRAAEECSLSAGKAFGLVAFDDLRLSRELGLTSLRQPYDQMGAEAGKMICAALSGQRVPMEVTLQPSTVSRISSQPFNEERT